MDRGNRLREKIAPDRVVSIIDATPSNYRSPGGKGKHVD